VKRAALAALVVVLGLAWASPSASAHALLRSSEPAAGETLSTAPAAATLHFTERPDPGLSVVHVLDSNGRAVERGPASSVPGDSQAITVPLPTLPQGVYTVNWRTTSEVDGHTTVGSFSFGVGVTPTADAATGQGRSVSRNPTPTPVGVAGRWLLYVGLALLAGAAAVRLLDPSPMTAWPAWIIAAAAVTAAAGLALNAADQASVAHAGLDTYIRSRAGRPIRLEIGAAVLTLAAAVLWRVRPGRATTVALGATALLAMVARVDAGHAAASTVPWFTVPVQSAHFVAAGAWIGGLPFLAWGLGRASAGDERVQLARRFSRLATIGLAVVVVTGTARAVDEVGAWDRLIDAAFGQALLVKLALVAGLIAVGWTNRRRLVQPERMGRSVRVEAAVAALVLVATAVLTGIAPSSSGGASATRTAPAAVVVNGSDFATTTRVRLTATPGRPGPNRFDAVITDYDTGAPVAAERVALRFQFADRGDVAPSTLALRRSGERWTGEGLNLSVDGRWRITVAIDTAAGGREVPLELETALPPQRIDAQRTPGLPTIYTVTAASGKLQVYFDPGRPGPNQLHLTFLRGDGEADVADVAVTVDGASPETRRLDKGHFVADVDARPGIYRITTTATLTDGSTRRYRLSVPIPN
jgi:copper transport protein